MKLFVVRHAESPFGPADHERTLSMKGKMQAAKSGEFIATQCDNSAPTAIICSDATRTQETAQIIQQKLNGCELISDYRYYGGQVGDWCDAIYKRSTTSQLVLVGHNPIISFLHHHLSEQDLAHYTPACVGYFELEIATDGLKLPANLKQFYSPDANH